MTKIATYVITILVAFLFAMTVPSWQVTVANRGNAASMLARQLWSGESSTPSSPLNILNGRNIYRGACADCHGSGQSEFGIGAGHPVSSAQHAPRDIHQLITFGQENDIPENVEYSGRAYDIKGDHPVYPAKLTDSERWAVSIYLISANLDSYSGDDDQGWIQSWRIQLNPPGSGDSGVEIFIGNCASCHGPEGYGNGPLASDLASRPASLRDTVWLANQSDVYLFSVIQDGKFTYEDDDTDSLPIENETWSGMPSWGDYLTENQIIALVNYIRSFSYSVDETETTIESYEFIEPDYNRWEWSQVTRELRDVPESAPEWMETDQE